MRNHGTRPAKVRDRKNEQVRRNEGSARKLDRQKVSELAKQGVSTHDIAQHQGVHHVTVWRFLKALQPQQAQLATFKGRRADCLAHIHGQALDVQERVLERMREDLEDDEIMAAMSPTGKAKYLQAAVITGGVSYDKERLEKNMSNLNVSLMELIASVDEQAWPRKGQVKKEDPPLIDGTVTP